jgi:hypothetical protein
MWEHKTNLWVGLAFLLAPIWIVSAQTSPEETILNMLEQDQSYHTVPATLFEQLGWDLPDGGSQVKKLADDSPGNAIDPRILETLPSDKLGYSAKCTIWIGTFQDFI